MVAFLVSFAALVAAAHMPRIVEHDERMVGIATCCLMALKHCHVTQGPEWARGRKCTARGSVWRCGHVDVSYGCHVCGARGQMCRAHGHAMAATWRGAVTPSLDGH